MVDSQPTGEIRRVFVGLQREMAQLEAALEEVLASQERLVGSRSGWESRAASPQ